MTDPINQQPVPPAPVPPASVPPAGTYAPAPPAAYAPAGYAVAPTGYAVAPQRTNVLAIISLVAAFFISLAAVITGHIALSQIKRTGENGRGLAIAGLVLGYIGIAGGIIAIVIMVLLGLATASLGSVSSY